MRTLSIRLIVMSFLERKRFILLKRHGSAYVYSGRGPPELCVKPFPGHPFGLHDFADCEADVDAVVESQVDEAGQVVGDAHAHDLVALRCSGLVLDLVAQDGEITLSKC